MHTTFSNSFVVIGKCLLALLWLAVSRPLFAVLVILEPLVRAILCGLALLVLLTLLFFWFLAPPLDVPYGCMLALSIACILLLQLYYVLVRWLR
jgi:hypothetical protein